MIRSLIWDSKFWGYKIADYDGKDELDNNELSKYDLVQCRVEISNTELIRYVEEKGFRFIDLNTTYELDINIGDISCKYDIANENDIIQIENIASKIFKHSRYNIFDKEKVNKFYRLWALRAVEGSFDDVCFVKRYYDEIVGFVSIKNISNSIIKIGLIGVKEEFQSKNVGKQLLEQVKNYAYKKNIKKVQVSTQGSNIGAQRFYGKFGFSLKEISVWLYLMNGV